MFAHPPPCRRILVVLAALFFEKFCQRGFGTLAKVALITLITAAHTPKGVGIDSGTFPTFPSWECVFKMHNNTMAALSGSTRWTLTNK
jgi:hypothetical protein